MSTENADQTNQPYNSNHKQQSERFSFIENVTPILLRSNDSIQKGPIKKRISLDGPLFRRPINHIERHYSRDISPNGIKKKGDIDGYGRKIQDNGVYNSNIYKASKEGAYSIQQHSYNGISEDLLSCDSDGGVNDAISPEGLNHTSSDYSSSKLKQVDTVGSLNVREMASFLERTDSFIRMLEPVSDKKTSKAAIQRSMQNHRSWSAEYSEEQYSTFSKLLNSHDGEFSLQQMERFIELQKENAHLKERLLWLQNKLENSEKENMKLRDELMQYRPRENSVETDGILTFSSFEYSQDNLKQIMNRVGMPNQVIEWISVQIELEYHRHSNENYLLTALSYCFDYMMRLFLEEEHEFSTGLASYSSRETTLYYPHYSEQFKDFIDSLSFQQYQDYYDEIKQFVIEQWIVIYNDVSNHYGKTTAELIRDFCAQIEGRLREAFERDITVDVQDTEIKEGLEQLIMNMLGAGLLNTMIQKPSKKESVLNQHIKILQFVQPVHLDVKEQYVDHPLFQTAIQYIQSIVHCRSPKHMLICLSECTKTLFSILGSEHSSADDFLPLFIFCILKSKTYFLYSISEYINQFRDPKDLVMGNGYMLVNLISSLQFIISIDAHCLAMNPIDYQMLYAAAEDAIREAENKRFSIF